MILARLLSSIYIFPNIPIHLHFIANKPAKSILNVYSKKNSISFKRSHDLRYLLDSLDDAIPLDRAFYERIMKLNAFGIEIRYPDVKFNLSNKDREEAIEVAKGFRVFLKNNVGFEFE